MGLRCDSCMAKIFETRSEEYENGGKWRSDIDHRDINSNGCKDKQRLLRHTDAASLEKLRKWVEGKDPVKARTKYRRKLTQIFKSSLPEMEKTLRRMDETWLCWAHFKNRLTASSPLGPSPVRLTYHKLE